MRLNKWLIFIVAAAVLAVAGLAGLKLAKKIRREARKPKLFEARSFIDGLAGPTIGPELKVFTASSLDRIFLDGRTLLKPVFDVKASLSAARNEYESFQVVVYPTQKNMTGVYLQVSDLADPKTNNKIPVENITWRQVGYVPTETPYYPVKFVGLWPDPLLPVKSVDINAGAVQPFWVTVYVPETTPPGDYLGTVTVGSLEFPARQVPVSVHVYDFVLPKENTLKTAFDFYGHMTKVRYPQGEMETSATWHARLDDLNDKFIIGMLKHRMNPILNIDPPSQYELGNVDRYRVYGLNNFAIGKKGGTFQNNWPKDAPSIEAMLPLYRTYAEHLLLNKMLDYTYIYTWDEGEMDNPLVPKIANMVHKAYPGLKNMVCYHGLWDPSENPEWGKDIDIWTFQIDNFDETKMRKLQKMGMEILMYISGPSGATTPQLALDFDSIDYRIIPWICWKFDIRGFLYWCVNWWPNVDPFHSARNAEWEQNGNGLLMYPGPDGPIDSLRIEIFRDGMEDYEYIQILLGKLKVLRSQGLDEKYKDYFNSSKQVLTMDDSIVASMGQFTRDGEYLKSRRDAIARKIEEFRKLPGGPQ